MLKVVEEGIRSRICHAIYWCATSNNKYMKDYNQNKESSYLITWMQTVYICYVWKSQDMISWLVNSKVECIIFW